MGNAEKRIWRAKEVQSSGECCLKILRMGEKEHRYIWSICSSYIGLYGVFRVIRSWSGGYEDTGGRVRLAGCSARMRGIGIEDVPT